MPAWNPCRHRYKPLTPLWAAAYFFMLLAGYYVLRPLQPNERQEKLHAGLKPDREQEALAKWHAAQKG